MDRSKPERAEEIDWIRRCQRGDHEAFAPLVERYQRRVFGLVFHLVRRRDEVEDLAQEIFMKALTAIRSYNFQALFGTWLSQIAVNHCYDYLRRQRSSRVSYQWQMNETSARELESAAEGARAIPMTPERQALLGDLVTKLLKRAPLDDQVVLTLKELEELSVDEIAEILRLKPSTVKVRLHRARRRMLEDWKRLRQKGASHAM